MIRSTYMGYVKEMTKTVTTTTQSTHRHQQNTIWSLLVGLLSLKIVPVYKIKILHENTMLLFIVWFVEK